MAHIERYKDNSSYIYIALYPGPSGYYQDFICVSETGDQWKRFDLELSYAVYLATDC